MNLSPVAADYIRTHRAECSDGEIRRALKAQGFSDRILDDAFDDAGPRVSAAAAASIPAGKRALVRLLFTVSALCFLASGVLFVRNLLRISRQPQRSPPAIRGSL